MFGRTRGTLRRAGHGAGNRIACNGRDIHPLKKVRDRRRHRGGSRAFRRAAFVILARLSRARCETWQEYCTRAGDWPTTPPTRNHSETNHHLSGVWGVGLARRGWAGRIGLAGPIVVGEPNAATQTYGGVPKWPKGTGCKPVGDRLPRFESWRAQV